jgi:hypothetical protein
MTSATPITDRRYIRHPSAIPLEYSITETPPDYQMDYLNNVSEGGLSFHTSHYIEPETWVHLYIPIDENYFEADAKVRWCRQLDDNSYHVGVSFGDPEKAFSARMVEQICHIEQYKKTIRLKEGRKLTSDQAAAEWIEKYASKFPSVSSF